MAITQHGIGVEAGGQATKAAVFITIPVGAIIESVTTNPGGSPEIEDIMDADGAFHTRLVFEKGMHTASIVIVGKEYTKQAGEMDGANTDYFIDSVSEEAGKSARRTTITVTKLPTVNTTTTTTTTTTTSG